MQAERPTEKHKARSSGNKKHGQRSPRGPWQGGCDPRYLLAEEKEVPHALRRKSRPRREGPSGHHFVARGQDVRLRCMCTHTQAQKHIRIHTRTRISISIYVYIQCDTCRGCHAYTGKPIHTLLYEDGSSYKLLRIRLPFHLRGQVPPPALLGITFETAE